MKRLISIILLAVVLCTTLAVCASSEAIGGPVINCPEHAYKSTHIGHVSAVEAYHQLSDGTLCKVTRLTLKHQQVCVVCGTYGSIFIAECAQQHSVCGGSYSCPY